MPNHVLQTALTLVRAGLSVIPIGAHKRPALASWKPYQARLATVAELDEWFSNHEAGIAIIAGAISGNTEILDFDDIATLKPWYSLVEGVAPGLVSHLVVVMTPTGGRHIYYRCASIQGNTKLAVNSNREVMIETRGEGGYALIPPSPAWCHPDHKPYVLRQGDLANIRTITADERNMLLNCARALNAYVEPERVYTPREGSTPTGDRPGDLFAAMVSWEDILRPHGWRVIGHRGEVTLWCRPGKNHGVSATTGHCGDHLYVFSSNAHPFEPERAYRKFTAFTLLNFGSSGMDFHKAAVDLAAKGYVNRHEGRLATGDKNFGAHRPFGTFGAYRGGAHVASPRTIERTQDDARLLIRAFKRERGKIIVDAEAWSGGELVHTAEFPLLDQRESAHFLAFAGRERTNVDWQKMLMDVSSEIREALDTQQRSEAQAKPGKRVEIVTLSDVEAEPIEWLWEPYIAIGKICMADGDPGIGKTLTLTQLAARLSRGWPLPDQQGRLTLWPGGTTNNPPALNRGWPGGHAEASTATDGR